MRWLDGRVEQIPQAEDRYDLYLENKSWEKAAEAAARLKDPRQVNRGQHSGRSWSRAWAPAHPTLEQAKNGFWGARGEVCGGGGREQREWDGWYNIETVLGIKNVGGLLLVRMVPSFVQTDVRARAQIPWRVLLQSVLPFSR